MSSDGSPFGAAAERRRRGESFVPREQARRVVLIADGFAGGSDRMPGAAVQRRVLAALRGAPLWVHLRDHGIDAETFAEAAASFVPQLRDAQHVPLVSVNTHLDVAESLGVGVHLGGRGPSVAEARHRLGGDALVSASVHTVAEAEAAATAGANALFFSPIFPTSSKPGQPGVGLAALRACFEAVPGTPVVALGGITPERVRPCLDAGAWSVAVLSGLLFTDHPAETAARYHVHLRRP